MTRTARLAAASVLALCACAGEAHSTTPSVNGSVVPVPGAASATMRPLQTLLLAAAAPEPARAARKRRGQSAPAARVDAANQSAMREPNRHDFVNAAQVYPWSQGALYRLYAAPERVSDIALQPGERLISVASGDTVRWVIGDTTSGAGPERQTHILVKPSAAGLRTNLVIATDRRVYHVQLESTSRSSMASMSWTYPEDELLALRSGQAATGAAAPVAEGLALEGLNFGYRIRGDEPAWRPVRVFDDGRQVFIEFPPGLPSGEAPPLFVVGMGGKAELVNYRLRGRYYVVDRLFEEAELRLGEKKQKVVRISRTGETRRRGRRERAS